MIFFLPILLVFNIFAQEEIILQRITVKEGETLWSIANKYLLDPKAWPEILKYNKLPVSDLHVVLPGMELLVPVRLIKKHLRIAAYVVYFLNKVDYKRAKEVKWSPVKINLEIFNEDAIRTYEKSIAHVRFISGEIVRIDGDSYIVVRPEEKKEEVELLDGAVRAKKAKIVTASAVIEPKISDSDFKARLTPDKITLIEVYKGLVDVTAQGKTVTLKAGFGTRVRPLSVPDEPMVLPDIPKTEKVVHQEVFLSDMNLSLKIPMAQFAKLERKKEIGKDKPKIVGGLEPKYHLQVSTDVDFMNIVIDKKGKISEDFSLNFKEYKLNDGKYYYRISYIDEFGFESDFSKPVVFYIDTTAPVLTIKQPKQNEQIDVEMVHIIGETEKDAKVFIDGRMTELNPDGGFHIARILKFGENTIKIDAKDKAGNSSFVELKVYRIKKEELSKDDVRNYVKPEEDVKQKTKTGISILKISLTLLAVAIITGVFIAILG